MEPEVIRSRAVRENILRMLHTMFTANAAILMRLNQIYEGFSTGLVQYLREEVDAELADLAAHGLIEAGRIPAPGPIPELGYRITSRGRDFVRARFPWGRVDEYTGDQKVAP